MSARTIQASPICWFCGKQQNGKLTQLYPLYRAIRHGGSGIYKVEYTTFTVVIPSCTACKNQEKDDGKLAGSLTWISLLIALLTIGTIWYAVDPPNNGGDWALIVIASVCFSFVTFKIFFWILAGILAASGVLKVPNTKIACDHPAVRKLKGIGWTDNPPLAKYSPTVNEFFNDQQTKEYASQIQNEAKQIASNFGVHFY